METNNEPRKTGNKKVIAITAVIAVAACIVAVAVIFTTAGSTERRLAEQLDLAERYLSELEYEQAIVAYEEAISIDPKNETAYLGLADAYVGLGDYESAIGALEDGIAALGDDEAKADAVEELRDRLAELQAEYESIKEAERLAAEEAAEIAAAGETEEPAEEEAAANRVPYAEEMAAIADASVGDIVYLGSYEQDNNTGNGTEPVEWYVLDKADGEVTLLSVYLLDCQPYHADYVGITWENCTLRSWLNGEFYNTAFSAEEQAAIVNTGVVNEDNPHYGTEGGNDTTDKVWLLSLGEIERYFHIDRNVFDEWASGNMSWYEYAIYCYGQDNRVCAKPTAYANIRLGTYSEENVPVALEEGYDMSYAVGNGWWWLRSPGSSSDIAAYVGLGGGVNVSGYGVDYCSSGVRPALKVAY